MSDAPARIGVLSFHESKETKAICNAIEALGHHPEWLHETNTVLHLKDGNPTLIPDVDVVANRLLLSNTDQPAEELGIANMIASLRPTLNTPHATAVASHKIAAATMLADAGLPVPNTFLSLSAENLNRYRREFGAEAVYKTAIGTHGGGTWKVTTDEPLTAKVGSRQAFLQEFIHQPNTPAHDLRVYIVDTQIIGAMYRYAPEGDWRTNVARGGSVEDATDSLPPEAARLAMDATTTIGLDYAGVDLIEGTDGWYVLEVNPTAGFKGLYQATGVSPAPFIARQAIEYAGHDVPTARVEELAVTLDDSDPSCMPVLEPVRAPEPVVIGLTERVVVSGASGTLTVTGRADTGRAETCIDVDLAAMLGAVPRGNDQSRTGDGPVVDLVLGIGGDLHTVSAPVEKRADRDHALVLGRDVLRHYRVDVGREAGPVLEAPSEE